jgi:hypothetical protein
VSGSQRLGSLLKERAAARGHVRRPPLVEYDAGEQVFAQNSSATHRTGKSISIFMSLPPDPQRLNRLGILQN